MLSLLIEKKSPLNVKNKDIETPLIIAVQNNFVDCVTLLIQAGADLNPSDSKRNTALNIAATKG
jgi:ankyrin repeat protein